MGINCTTATNTGLPASAAPIPHSVHQSEHLSKMGETKSKATDGGSFHSTTLITLLMSGICLILVITEITLFAKRNLRPITYLVFQSVKTTFWTILFLISLVNAMKKDGFNGYMYTSEVRLLAGLIQSTVVL